MAGDATHKSLSEQLDPDRPVVIFDGICGLCNRSVDFIMRHDEAERFLFAPNQSDAAEQLLMGHGLDSGNVDTIYLYDNGSLYERSDAVLRIAASLPLPYRAGVAGRLLPRVVRDAMYRFIASRRYRWFGKNETCRLPTPEERSRFLD